MYFIEKISDEEGRVIRHKFLDDSGKEHIESVALCFSEERVKFITNLLNVYEDLCEKEIETTKTLEELTKDFLTNQDIKDISMDLIESFYNNIEKLIKESKKESKKELPTG